MTIDSFILYGLHPDWPKPGPYVVIQIEQCDGTLEDCTCSMSKFTLYIVQEGLFPYIGILTVQVHKTDFCLISVGIFKNPNDSCYTGWCKSNNFALVVYNILCL